MGLHNPKNRQPMKGCGSVFYGHSSTTTVDLVVLDSMFWNFWTLCSRLQTRTSGSKISASLKRKLRLLLQISGPLILSLLQVWLPANGKFARQRPFCNALQQCCSSRVMLQKDVLGDFNLDNRILLHPVVWLWSCCFALQNCTLQVRTRTPATNGCFFSLVPVAKPRQDMMMWKHGTKKSLASPPLSTDQKRNWYRFTRNSTTILTTMERQNSSTGDSWNRTIPTSALSRISCRWVLADRGRIVPASLKSTFPRLLQSWGP